MHDIAAGLRNSAERHPCSGAVRSPNALQQALRGVESGLHVGMQVYASLHGVPFCDFGVGMSSDTEVMEPETPVRWLSATKPLVALLIGQLCTEDALDLDSPASRFVGKYGHRGKEGVRIRHLLTHSVPYASDIPPAAAFHWDTAVAAACDLELQTGRVPGNCARYTAFASWQILGEIIQRVTGNRFVDEMTQRVLGPVGCRGVALGGDASSGAAAMAANTYDARNQLTRKLTYTQPSSGQSVVPGTGFAGPARELGRIYEAILAGRSGRGPFRIFERSLLDMATTHRSRLFDPMYGASIAWGLGVITDRRMFAGTRVSPHTFGHDGRLCAITFADPDRELVVCVIANTLCEPKQNAVRLRRVVNALLDDVEAIDGAVEQRSMP